MTEQPDADPQQPVAAARTAHAAQPPRPGFSYTAPAPILAALPKPRTVRAAQALWLFSFAAGLAVLIGSFMTRDSHLQRLRGVVEQMAPGGESSAVSTSAAVVFWGSVGALLVLILLETGALAASAARHGWARWLMIPLLAGHVLVMVLTAAFLVPDGVAAGRVVLLWSAEVLLAFCGLVALFMPSTGRWLRAGRNPVAARR